MTSKKQLKICKNGHRFYKSSDCPACPVCNKHSRPDSGFLSLLASPARNALLAHGLDSEEKLSRCTEREILAMHGIGKSTIPVLRKALEKAGLSFGAR